MARRSENSSKAISSPADTGSSKETARRRKTPGGASDRAHAYLRVADAIQLRILNGQLHPGDRLPSENDLAKEHGVGRTTAREALRLLASTRLIETRLGVQGGAFVTHPNPDDIDDMMMKALTLMSMSGGLRDDELAEATAYTMPTVARIAALRATDEELERLGELAAALGQAKNDDEWVQYGSQFNTLLVEMTRNRVFALFIKPLMRVSPTLYKEHRLTPGWREATAERYREIANEIRRRAPDAAADAMLRLRQSYVPSPVGELLSES